MILYFSGTGNSRYTAERLAAALDEKTLSINERLLEDDSAVLQSATPLVFVFPIYAWRLPRVVEGFIRRRRFEGNREAYFVATCGSDAGRAGHYARRLCEEKGFAYRGLAAVVMPENFITMFSAPEPGVAEAIIARSAPRIGEIAAAIKAGRPLPPEKTVLLDRVKSDLFNPLFYTFAVKADGFWASDSCTGCGACATLCPLGNIRLAQDRRPVWGKECTQCMACIGGCPAEAVEYGRRTRGKRRYFFPSGADCKSE